MIDSETARLLLAYYAEKYQETDHLFGWVSLLTLFQGGYGQVPFLHGAGLHLSGPRAMAEHFDPTLPPERRLLPREQPLRTIVEADWKRYNGGLAADVAAVCYHHMLPERSVMTELFARSVPRNEARLAPTVYPALRWLFSILLRLNKPRVDDALLRIRVAFDVTDRIIADGRPFLAGDRLTLGDIGLAAAAAPLLLPDHYSAPVPTVEQMPPPLHAIVAELRAHPTATFVGRLYAGIAGARV
jgi:glutathione S-transferase